LNDGADIRGSPKRDLLLKESRKMLAKIVFVGIVLLGGSIVSAEPTVGQGAVYQGTWKTTNRKLDGTMTCVVTPVASEKWKGRFYGTWQGVDFDYTVDMLGPADKLCGTATIDGASYEWKGWIRGDTFKTNFGGDRYTGSFELKKTKAIAPAVVK
jgi:hypothetical protein